MVFQMATQTSSSTRDRASAPSEPAVVYRGIKIDPISGKRSAVARALRDALKLKSNQSDGQRIDA
jgi:hypothetical protein